MAWAGAKSGVGGRGRQTTKPSQKKKRFFVGKGGQKGDRQTRRRRRRLDGCGTEYIVVHTLHLYDDGGSNTLNIEPNQVSPPPPPPAELKLELELELKNVSLSVPFRNNELRKKPFCPMGKEGWG